MKKLISISLFFLSLAGAVILTLFSREAADLARNAIKLCALSVIPSLFPYMVISSIIVSGGCAPILGNVIPITRFLYLPKCAGASLFLGSVCGFPVGGSSAVDMYSKGLITKKQAEVLIACANNTGPSFIVSVIGGAFFSSTAFGWKLYFFQLISSLISSLIINRIVFPCRESCNKSSSTKVKIPDFSSAVSDAVRGSLTVSGFVVFFSVVSGIISPLLTKLSPLIACTAASFLEFTNGASLASQLGGAPGRFFAGFSVGFSGISVLCQTLAFTKVYGISLKRTACTKLFQGIICGIMTMLFAKGSYRQSTITTDMLFNTSEFFHSSPIPIALICLGLYLFLIKNIIKQDKI